MVIIARAIYACPFEHSIMQAQDVGIAMIVCRVCPNARLLYALHVISTRSARNFLACGLDEQIRCKEKSFTISSQNRATRPLFDS